MSGEGGLSTDLLLGLVAMAEGTVFSLGEPLDVEEPAFGFSHALVRQALAATVGATRTAFIHRQAGRALSRRQRPYPRRVGVLDGWRLCPRCGHELVKLASGHAECPNCGRILVR